MVNSEVESLMGRSESIAIAAGASDPKSKYILRVKRSQAWNLSRARRGGRVLNHTRPSLLNSLKNTETVPDHIVRGRLY